jgi:hypothetical protein
MNRRVGGGALQGAGEVVYEQDDDADKVFVVLEGHAMVHVYRKNKKIRVRNLGPGCVAGGLSCFVGIPHRGTVRFDAEGRLVLCCGMLCCAVFSALLCSALLCSVLLCSALLCWIAVRVHARYRYQSCACYCGARQLTCEAETTFAIFPRRLFSQLADNPSSVSPELAGVLLKIALNVVG